MKTISIYLVGILAYFASVESLEACTRVVYTGDDNVVVTGRTMDWDGDIPTNMWIFPRGMNRNGEAGENSLAWKSKYGSVIISSFDFSTADGMNEKGLVANLLWLGEVGYPERNENIPGLNTSVWIQYLLDNCATVNEAVEAMQSAQFQIVGGKMPFGTFAAPLHVSISDASGDNAIFEFIGGSLVTHHGKEYKVMTNSPTYEKQLAITDYWRNIGGRNFLPGSDRAADRFAKATFYLEGLPQTISDKDAVSGVFSIIRNASVPFGVGTKDHPELASTQWRTLLDSKNLRYYFESAHTPSTFWVDFKNINFKEGAPVMKLSLEDYEYYTGEVSKQFKSDQPFLFFGVKE